MASGTQLDTGFDGAVWLAKWDKKFIRGFKSGVAGPGAPATQPVIHGVSSLETNEPVTNMEAPLMEFTVQYICPVRNPSTTNIGCFPQEFKPASAGRKSCPPERR